MWFVRQHLGYGRSVVELNTKGRYAVMAMADIAQRTSACRDGRTDACAAAREADHDGNAEDAVPLSAIADRQRLSLSYLEQLFAKLRRAGLVESARGRSGGYRLARPARDISIAEIMDAVEEGVRMTRCHGAGESAPCVPGERCITHDLWNALGSHINGFLASVTLEQVVSGALRDGAPTARAVPAVVFSGGVVSR